LTRAIAEPCSVPDCAADIAEIQLWQAASRNVVVVPMVPPHQSRKNTDNEVQPMRSRPAILVPGAVDEDQCRFGREVEMKPSCD
jgi:hypothetical protein